MAFSTDFPLIDGVAPSFADISVSYEPSAFSVPGLSSVPGVGALLAMKEIKAINTSRSVEVGKQRGASGGRVMRVTTGQQDQEASITLYRYGYQNFYRKLATVAPLRNGVQKAVSLVKFNITIQHTPPGSLEIFERELRGCRVLGDTMNSAEGPDAQEVEVPLYVAEIVDVIDGFEVVLL